MTKRKSKTPKSGGTPTNRFSALVAWRQKKLTPGLGAAELADHLSVEKVEKSGFVVPERLYADLVAFRHLRQDARVTAVRRVIGDQPKKATPKKDSTIIAVCGYVSQRFESTKDARSWIEDRLLRYTYPRAFIVEGQVTVIEKNFKIPLRKKKDV